MRVFSHDGALLTEASFSTNGSWLTGERLALTGSVSDTAARVLVGWVGAPTEGGKKTYLKRFDCSDE